MAVRLTCRLTFSPLKCEVFLAPVLGEEVLRPVGLNRRRGPARAAAPHPRAAPRAARARRELQPAARVPARC